jgi:hypothetical protein
MGCLLLSAQKKDIALTDFLYVQLRLKVNRTTVCAVKAYGRALLGICQSSFLFRRFEMKRASGLGKDANEKLKLPALTSEVRKSLAEILNRPLSDLKGHQAFKSDQKKLALWAADCAENVLPFFEEKYPNDERPRKAIAACRTWAATGVFKMAVIRKASLDSHAAARVAEKDSAPCYAARAAGQAVATAHVPTHSMGAAVYAIKAVAAHTGNPDDGLIREREWQLQRLREYAKRTDL